MLRKDVDEKLKWDLTDLVKDDEDFEKKLEEKVSLSKKIFDFKGKIKDLKTLEEVLKLYEKYLEVDSLVGGFANLYFSEDGTNTKAYGYLEEYDKADTVSSANMSFLDDEIMELSDDVLDEALEKLDFALVYLRRLKKDKAHKPPFAVVDALTKLNPVFNAPYGIWEGAIAGDVRFKSLKLDKEVPMTFGLYEDKYEGSSDTELRRKSFEEFVSVMRKYQTTLALNYNTQLKAEKALSEIYGFESVFDYLLDLQDIRREVYEDHIDTLKRELPKHMRKYAKLVKEKYGLDKMTYADLKAPLMPEFEKEISIEDSKDYLRKGLAIFGEDYVNETLKHIDNKWIDFAQNEGKSTGAFCAPYYQLHSYVLISWMGKMEDVFVLAHELGHAGHGRYSSMDNSVINTESSMYISEMPSTCNEMLLANYLINSTVDEEFKKWVRVQMIERTYYHNFVTHGIEAIYQREVYRRIDKGENINADKLNEIFRNTLEEFWGEDVKILPGSELTWMRQPHYFMGLYPFTYQAGLSIGTELFRKLQTSTDSKKKEIIENYKETMKTGGKLSPEDWAKKLGVQIEGGKALKDTIQYIGVIIDEISK